MKIQKLFEIKLKYVDLSCDPPLLVGYDEIRRKSWSIFDINKDLYLPKIGDIIEGVMTEEDVILNKKGENQ